MKTQYEVIIIGGSYAGLSAAMALGRSLRNVLVIDSGKPCNRQTPHSHNFLTQDGKAPAEIASIAKAQVAKYQTVDFFDDLAISGTRTAAGFTIKVDSGDTFSAPKLVFATGIKDIMPNIKGFAECWGISVVHCPYCHGYEVKGQTTGILANGDTAKHLAPLVGNLTDKLTIYTNGKPEFSIEDLEQLEKHNIDINAKVVREVEHQNGRMNKLIFKDGSSAKLDAIYARLPFAQHSDIPEELGCEINDQGYIAVNAFQQTNIDGIYACGDSASPLRAVANAVYSGNLVGAMVNRELCEAAF
ncbi:thioredoxin reductase [Roseivirga pacifica]|uniref:Thioredoxin reductase n=1 Tax=Roseivirga pacifica TaxID=1267423 RepID=A0A1I0QQD4_9BACT|nr:NAD(P)/FAD-dependent oxidoreductase [Roseivirga pacifica]RKQ42685.1 thioredoxin reductase [Roseivirga pacifica]SEW29717.1 Thioredoxin reductase [Roseivirga pacifica]